MEEVIFGYRKLLELISEEEQYAVHCFEGEILETYKDVLSKERKEIEQQLKKLYY